MAAAWGVLDVGTRLRVSFQRVELLFSIKDDVLGREGWEAQIAPSSLLSEYDRLGPVAHTRRGNRVPSSYSFPYHTGISRFWSVLKVHVSVTWEAKQPGDGNKNLKGGPLGRTGTPIMVTQLENTQYKHHAQYSTQCLATETSSRTRNRPNAMGRADPGRVRTTKSRPGTHQCRAMARMLVHKRGN
ncbi:hypothetical protein LZ31DRAFT_91209 [Colletotrichum somersetense]|nr:hypothetical protein LZ31DRAFT_91209 [Colletotrichum somersetense]